RALLTAASVAITVTGIVAVLTFHATADRVISGAASGIGNPVVSRDEQMLMVVTVVLVALATLNAICSTWTTMLDNRHAAALSRALGASPSQVSAGLTAALVMPALPGAVIGVPLGIGLFKVANHGGVTNVPPVWWLVAAVLVTLFVLGLLSAIPARFGARRPAAEALGAESAELVYSMIWVTNPHMLRVIHPDHEKAPRPGPPRARPRRRATSRRRR